METKPKIEWRLKRIDGKLKVIHCDDKKGWIKKSEGGGVHFPCSICGAPNPKWVTDWIKGEYEWEES